jgi:hypothetical protein
MNTLRALLGDLGKDYSIYASALDVSNKATNQAIQRNRELNKTLDAQINQMKARLTIAGKGIGEAVLGPSIENIIKIFDKVFGYFEKGDAKGRSLGQDIAVGFIKGFGEFLSGPGLAAIAILGMKIVVTFSKYMGQAALEFMEIQSQSMKIAATQKVVAEVLGGQEIILNKLIAGTITGGMLKDKY